MNISLDFQKSNDKKTEVRAQVSTSFSKTGEYTFINCCIYLYICIPQYQYASPIRNRCGRDHMVVGLTTTYTISAYHHWSCEFSIQHYVKSFCQSFATGQWFSQGTPVFSTNKTDCLDITEILLKVALNTITLTLLHPCQHQNE